MILHVPIPDLDSWCWVLSSVLVYSKSNVNKTQLKIYTHPFLNILVNYISEEVQENHTQSPSHAAKEMKWDLSHLHFGILVNETRFIKIDIVHTYILHYQWIKLKLDLDTDQAYSFLLQNTEITFLTKHRGSPFRRLPLHNSINKCIGYTWGSWITVRTCWFSLGHRDKFNR